MRDKLSEKLSIEEYTKNFILHFQEDYSEKELAEMLGINPKTLWEKRQRYNIVRAKNRLGKASKAN